MSAITRNLLWVRDLQWGAIKMNKAKSLRMTFSDGSIWEIPALFIAEHRAKYYSKKDKDTTFEKEIDFALTDEYEFEDWAQNNMDFSDVKVCAVRVK